MKRWRLLFALAVLGLSARLAAANEPPLGVPGQIFYPHSQIAPPPRTPPTMVGPAFHTPPNYPHLENDPNRPRRVRVFMQRIGVGCWTHFNQVGCGNFGSEAAFILGSCRTFFHEPCAHGPQPVQPGLPIPPPNTIPYGVLPGNPITYAPPIVIR